MVNLFREIPRSRVVRLALVVSIPILAAALFITCEYPQESVSILLPLSNVDSSMMLDLPQGPYTVDLLFADLDEDQLNGLEGHVTLLIKDHNGKPSINLDNTKFAIRKDKNLNLYVMDFNSQGHLLRKLDNKMRLGPKQSHYPYTFHPYPIEKPTYLRVALMSFESAHRESGVEVLGPTGGPVDGRFLTCTGRISFDNVERYKGQALLTIERYIDYAPL